MSSPPASRSTSTMPPFSPIFLHASANSTLPQTSITRIVAQAPASAASSTHAIQLHRSPRAEAALAIAAAT